MITYYRQFGRPKAAEKWFKHATRLTFNGQQVHHWPNSWQIPAWFTPGLSSQPFWSDDLSVAAWMEDNSDSFIREFKALLASPIFNKQNQVDHALITNGT